jgi:hypothetical protein
MHFPHCVAISKKLHWLVQTKVSMSKMQCTAFTACGNGMCKRTLKIRHSDLIVTDGKSFLDFIKDSYAALVQYETPPMFVNRPTFSAGSDPKIFFLIALKVHQ